MKFTGFAISFALAGSVSAADIPAVPGNAAIDNLEGTLGKVTEVVKRDGTDAISAKRQLEGIEGAVGGVVGAGLAAGVKRDGGAVSGAAYGITSSPNGVTGVAGSVAGTAESTTSGAVGTVEAEVAGIVPAKRQLPGLGNVVSASLANDLGMLSGNPSGLIGALSSGGILPSQVATFPAELQHVVTYLYTA
ncbi:hypothetical protein N7494_004828 [Penicillium frequentans]|uniref:Uncharacterized protein n=1 Tax=Penicillium frequentans TaxID=3151616 RepID=A0AAD6GJA2_9EURO|nr:hypothetical protein N7494_004828 [Penicillium glabrum]